MANTPISMRKVRELLRLSCQENKSARQAAQIVGIGKTAASHYIAGFKSSGLSYSAIQQLSDTDLLQAINVKKATENQRYQELSQLFPYFEKELKRTGVTLQLLWEEYKPDRKEHYEFSQFCHHFRLWRKESKVSMHMEHKAGDKLFVDFAGQKLSITNPTTGEITHYEVFVAVLGSSQYSYIEAVASQQKADWIAVNENALRFFGGVPAAIVPDCLKSAVIKANKYEPEINASYADFAEHYGTVILPARAMHPQDKSLAENFVRSAYTHIYAPLRNQVFFSIEELNQAIWERLEVYNQKKFQQRDYSRQFLFDQVEKKELRPLPRDYYDLKEFCQIKVQYNQHIYLKADKHYYSVPYQLTGKEVNVVYSSKNVEIYHNNLRVAMHLRNRHPYGYSTIKEHLSAEHQYVAKWSPRRFIKWAGEIGPEAERVITLVLESRSHPEQAYKSCMGILGLEKKYGKASFLKACGKALELNCIQYKFIKNTLETKAFNLTQESETENLGVLPKHENIRGKDMYN